MVKIFKRANKQKLSRELSIIQQGLQYVKSATRIRNKLNVGTNSKNRTSRTSLTRTKSAIKRKEVPKKIEVPKSRLIRKGDKKSKKVKKGTATRVTKINKDKNKSRASSARSKPITSMPPPVAATVPAVVAAGKSVSPIGRTGSRASQAGKVAHLSKSKSKDLQIPAFGFIDVCFCVDSTGSMSSELAQVQEVIKSIITNIQAKVSTQGLQLRFAIVSYRDHPPQESTYVTKHLDFTDQYQAIEYLKTLAAWGGGDQPEAAHDGLLVSAKNLRWAEEQGTPVLRYIFHIADAPPHGSEFSNPESQKGCLCGIQTDDVIREINKKNIHYRLIKARSNFKVDLMENIFKAKIGDFASTDINHARQLNVKVSDMIIHEVLPDYA